MIRPTAVMHPLPIRPVDIIVRTRPQAPVLPPAETAPETTVPGTQPTLEDAIRDAAGRRVMAQVHNMHPLPVIYPK